MRETINQTACHAQEIGLVPAIVILPYTLKLITLGPTTQSTCEQSGGQGQKQQPIKTEDFQDMLAHHLPLTGTSYQLFNKPTEDNCYDICIWGKRDGERKRGWVGREERRGGLCEGGDWTGWGSLPLAG